MSDEDRVLHGAFARLNDACEQMDRGIAQGNLSQEDHLELALLFLALRS